MRRVERRRRTAPGATTSRTAARLSLCARLGGLRRPRRAPTALGPARFFSPAPRSTQCVHSHRAALYRLALYPGFPALFSAPASLVFNPPPHPPGSLPPSSSLPSRRLDPRLSATRASSLVYPRAHNGRGVVERRGPKRLTPVGRTSGRPERDCAEGQRERRRGERLRSLRAPRWGGRAARGLRAAMSSTASSVPRTGVHPSPRVFALLVPSEEPDSFRLESKGSLRDRLVAPLSFLQPQRAFSLPFPSPPTPDRVRSSALFESSPAVARPRSSVKPSLPCPSRALRSRPPDRRPATAAESSALLPFPRSLAQRAFRRRCPRSRLGARQPAPAPAPAHSPRCPSVRSMPSPSPLPSRPSPALPVFLPFHPPPPPLYFPFYAFALSIIRASCPPSPFSGVLPSSLRSPSLRRGASLPRRRPLLLLPPSPLAPLSLCSLPSLAALSSRSAGARAAAGSLPRAPVVSVPQAHSPAAAPSSDPQRPPPRPSSPPRGAPVRPRGFERDPSRLERETASSPAVGRSRGEAKNGTGR